MAGRTCLLVFFCLSGGLLGFSPQARGRRSSGGPGQRRDGVARPAVSEDRGIEFGREIRRDPSAPGSADELGFKHTWKPRPTPPAKSSVAAPAVVAHPGAEDDRYAESAPAPAVGNQAEAAKTPA